MIAREIDFVCKIEITEDVKLIDEVIIEVCTNFQNIVNDIIKRRKLDAIIKKIRMSGMSNRR